MTWVEESGYEFELPEGRYFRFDECETYRTQLSHAHVSDVDFVWHEETSSDPGHVVWLTEVKNVRREGASRFNADEFVDDLVGQLTDGILMICGMWASSRMGRRLLSDAQAKCQEFPESPADVRVLLAFRLERSDSPQMLGPVVDRIRKRLKGRLRMVQGAATSADTTRIAYLALNHRSGSPIEVRPKQNGP